MFRHCYVCSRVLELVVYETLGCLPCRDLPITSLWLIGSSLRNVAQGLFFQYNIGLYKCCVLLFPCPITGFDYTGLSWFLTKPCVTILLIVVEVLFSINVSLKYCTFRWIIIGGLSLKVLWLPILCIQIG